MAGGPGPVIRTLAGGAVLGIVLVLTLGSVAALMLHGSSIGGGASPSAADWAAIRFTLIQSLVSAGLSVALAVPFARALMRRSFPLRGALLAGLGAPFLLPVIVAILGLLAVWGRSGALSAVSEALGGPRIDIYGLTGVVLAHVFFNLPLVTRLLVQGWQAIPAEQFRLATQLDLGPRDVFRLLEVPMLRNVLPGAFLLVFLLCMTSFAVALALGGGPGATTIELAIYQALRFDFDPAKAGMLALIQFGLCAALALMALLCARPTGFSRGRGRLPQRWDAPRGAARIWDMVVIGTLVLFLATPLALVVIRGGLALSQAVPQGLVAAAGTSLLLAISSACAAGLAALALAGFVAQLPRGRGVAVEAVGLLMLAASPFVIGTGLFLIIYPVADPFAFALVITGVINAAMSLPFGLRVLVPALGRIETEHGRLADSLGLSGLNRFRLITLPTIRGPLGFFMGLAAALSMGDLGVITLFAPPGVETLPLFMYRLMGSYRMDAAAGAALVLLILSLAVFWACHRGGRA